MTSFLRSDRSRPVAIWLFAVAALVLAMVVVGGSTRLTGSGLSITEWRPVTGAVPPMSDQAWQAEFAKYREIPQYQQVNRGMSLDDFKGIYWWEWAHRFLGRLVGLVFAVPFVVFLIRKDIPRRLIWRCGAMFALGGLQGAIGWWMVSSGLADRVSVAPERLAVHLGLALALIVLLFWTALDAWFGSPRQENPTRWRGVALAFLIGVFVQSLLGALVAGAHAGFTYNDWPLMNGALFPRDYPGEGIWHTIAHNQASVQLHHRIGAYILFGCSIALGVFAWRHRYLAPQAKQLAIVAVGVTLAQALLGIATLMTGVPLWLGILHQLGAVALLGAATAFAWRVRRL
ncbi:MAG: COX15/CtaA family protein [Phenylobacterium sp.]|nr:COX15/CtaA family protein [Phenylobacterium sp.]